MLTFGVFGIDNDALNTAVNVLLLVLVVVWFALVFWTFADARRRIDDPMLVGCATLASLFPFVGTIIYCIVRPPEYLHDVRGRRGRGAAALVTLTPTNGVLKPMDRTLILVKPDAFARNLTGEIIARFERKGLRIAALRHMTLDRQTAEQHYAEHQGKPFFEELVSFITSGPLVAMVLEGQDAVKAARQVIGATNPLEAAPGSIRGDFAIEVGQNMVHGSDSPESGVREAKLFFG